jgi:hypothetical protein
MDNPAVYGRQVYTLTVRDAIRKDIICPYRVLISTVTTAEVHEVLVKGDLIRARQVANQIALRDAIENTRSRKSSASIPVLLQRSLLFPRGPRESVRTWSRTSSATLLTARLAPGSGKISLERSSTPIRLFSPMRVA